MRISVDSIAVKILASELALIGSQNLDTDSVSGSCCCCCCYSFIFIHLLTERSITADARQSLRSALISIQPASVSVSSWHSRQHSRPSTFVLTAQHIELVDRAPCIDCRDQRYPQIMNALLPDRPRRKLIFLVDLRPSTRMCVAVSQHTGGLPCMKQYSSRF